MNKEELLEIEKMKDIPDAVIQKDIDDTQGEINQYHKEIKVLNEKPLKNITEIYLRLGRILTAEEFIKKLKQILEHRRKNENKLWK